MAHGYIDDDTYGIHNERDARHRRDESGVGSDYDRHEHGRDYGNRGMTMRNRHSGPDYRGNYRDEHRRDYRRSDDGRSFWDEMKDEARSWFGSDDRDSSRDRTYREDRDGRSGSAPADWSRGSSYGGYSASSSRDDWRDQRDSRWSGDRDFASGSYGGSRRAGQGPREVQGRNEGGQPVGYLVTEEYLISAPSANTDDHYRSLRDRHMQSLDRDYQDYCREREQQFHRDFSDWRRSRQGSSAERSQGSEAGMSGGRSATARPSPATSSGSTRSSGSSTGKSGPAKKENNVVSTARQSKESADQTS